MRALRLGVKDRKDIPVNPGYTVPEGNAWRVKVQQKFVQALGSMMITAGLFTGIVSAMAATV